MSRPTRDQGENLQIPDVLDRVDLAALLDEFTVADDSARRGHRWHCPVPDHADHRASVTMHRDHRGHERWRCWSGDHRGDAIDLVMAVTSRGRREAIEWLADRAGMRNGRPFPPIRPKRVSPSPAPASVMDPIVGTYVGACHRVLGSTGATDVREWLASRGLRPDTIRANQIGADPGRRAMSRRRGLPYGASVAATFPVFDPVGNLTYVQTRYLDVAEAGRKYDNPAASLAPNPRLGFVVSPVELRPGPILVCEGLPDALIAAQEGFESIAVLGANSPDRTVGTRLTNHLRNLEPEDGVVVVTDPDPAGRRVAEVLVPLLREDGHEVSAVAPPDGLDLNAWALDDADWADRLLDHALGPRSPMRDGTELRTIEI